MLLSIILLHTQNCIICEYQFEALYKRSDLKIDGISIYAGMTIIPKELGFPQATSGFVCF